MSSSSPTPTDTAATAWAMDPDHGPVFGERLERFDDANQAESVLHIDLALPCDFEKADGGRWHAERLAGPDSTTGGRVFLITSRDRHDSFNFEAAVVDGNVAVLVSLNSREDDRALLDQLLAIAVAKADDANLHGVGG